MDMLDFNAEVPTWVSGTDKYSGATFYGSYDGGLLPFLEVTTADAPASSFTVDHTGGITPLIVNFTDTSTNTPTAWQWYDGDTLFNTTQTPQFVAFTTGNHPIKLNASNAAGGTNSSVTWINVTAAPPAILPVANFSYSITNHDVQFTDLSVDNILGWNWSFGDGINSTDSNPLHTYAAVGTYSVILEVMNISGSNTTTKNVVINGTPPVANFTADHTTICTNDYVQFTDTSTGGTPTSWYWMIGTYWTSVDQNPYGPPGLAQLMTVNMSATNADGTSWMNRTGYLNVTNCTPVASYTISDSTPCTGDLVSFTDTSTHEPVLWEWYWYDNETLSTILQNPSNVFSTAGTYGIRLNASNDAGSDWENETIVVTNCTSTGTATATRLGQEIVLALTLVGIGLIVGGALFLVGMFTGIGGAFGRGGEPISTYSGGNVTTAAIAIATGATLLIIAYVIISPLFTIVGL